MSNLIHTSSLLLILFSAVAGFAQEDQEKKRQPNPKPADGGVVAIRSPAEYDPAAWKEFKSGAGRFSIVFPGAPREETERLKSEEHETTLHQFNLRGLANYAVMYFDDPVARDMNPEPTRKMLDATARQTLQTLQMFQGTSLEQKEITLDGHPGLFAMVRLPNGSIMRMKMYAVGRHMYQLMITTPPEQDATDRQRRFYEATADKFLNSFKLAPPPAIAPPVITGSRARGASEPSRENLPRAPITGGILNGRAISKPTPRYPAAAREAGVSGMVEVAITIDEEGKVIMARALSGPDELREAAVEAARKARFSVTRLSGQPVKVSGRLSYNFSLR